MASQGDCAALMITAWISTLTGAPGGTSPPGGIVVTSATSAKPTAVDVSGPVPPRGSVVGMDMMSAYFRLAETCTIIRVSDWSVVRLAPKLLPWPLRVSEPITAMFSA